MMKIYLTLIFCFFVNNLFAQKLIIDSTAYKTWPSLAQPTISKNGKYVFYTINNVPVGGKTTVVQSTDGKWKKEFKEGLKDTQQILSDKYFLFINKNDSLVMLTLGTEHIQYTPDISSCNLREIKGVEYLLYRSGRNSKDLILKDLKTNKVRSFNDVDRWDFDKDVLVLIEYVQGTDQKKAINLADIITGRVLKIWEGYKPENLILDVKHKQLAFKTGDSVWYYKFNSHNVVCISNKNFPNMGFGLTLGYLDSFSDDGNFLFTSLNRKGTVIKPRDGVVEIWSYTDIKLQTEQEKAANDEKYLTVIDLEDHRLIRLQQQEGEWFQFSNSGSNITAVILVENPKKVNYTDIWNIAYKHSWDLVTLKDGSRKRLSFLDNIGYAKLSPNGKYIIYFDGQLQAYFSYEIANGTIRNITKGISVSWANMDRDDLPGASSAARGIAVWLKNDVAVLVYDRYDIWKLDPSNKESPINLTNGYGKKNQIVFNCTFGSNAENVIGKNGGMYLTAFSKENKNNGFFLKQLDKAGDPELLYIGPYLYKINSCYVEDDGVSPINAMKSEMFLVRRMSATDAPNYFSTRDFKNFIRLTDLQPQKKYNWYTTELHSWKSLDGRTLQGILYKPENFDPNKKYPVIFHYYERKSDGLNIYLQPAPLGGYMNIDVPSYVSRGYLVFCPDIYYKVGDPMQGTYDAVVSAANYASNLIFVDRKRMGIQGGSFGGFQTNYLVTHSNLFAAAVSSAGVADWISAYGSLMWGTDSQQSYYESGQPRMGNSLWALPESYIKNSSIFQIEKVTTPLLMMHTRNDGICPFQNALEFFLGLRRMRKRSWMLIYSKGNHGIFGEEADDFSIRMMEFFDHYLKDKPAPIWISKGIRNGYMDDSE